MNRYQIALRDFHHVVMGDLPPEGSRPQIRDGMLRAKLIMEEASETANALTGKPVGWTIGMAVDPENCGGISSGCKQPDFIEAIDGQCDLIVVTLGTTVRMGIDLDPFMAEVHRTNMTKKDGPIREDGKRLKPEGWEPPNLAAVFRKEYPEWKLNDEGEPE